MAVMSSFSYPQESHSHASPNNSAGKGAHDHGVDAQGGLEVTRIIRAPQGFAGNLTYDRQAGRLWLISMGPPANIHGPSKLYELDVATGRVLAETQLPFKGELAAPVHIDGFLYQAVAHESTLHKIDVGRESNFGQVVQSIPLPKLNELETARRGPFRFPFIAFTAAFIADEKLILYAEDLGEFITIDRKTGQVVNRVETLRGLTGVTSFTGPSGQALVLANVDPSTAKLRTEFRTFMFRSAHGITPLSDAPTQFPCNRSDARDISWALLDPNTGEVLAATKNHCAEFSGSTSLLQHTPLEGHVYGTLTFLVTGEQGIYTVQWTPDR